MSEIRAGVVGGAGYTGGEMLRILLRHPRVKIEFVLSKSNAGKPVFEVHRDLFGETDLMFSDRLSQDIDLLFLCTGHGQSREFLDLHEIGNQTKVIDLSQDYRLKKTSDGFIYGLPELNREKIKKAIRVANPGCFATCIQLGLLPLAAANSLQNEVHISAMTGSTGAGFSPSATTHFSWRNNNISVYKAFSHQHMHEISESIHQLAPEFNRPVNFIPFRGNFTRGILASIYTDSDKSLEEVQEIYEAYYEPHPFVKLSDLNPDLKQVVNTNKCILHLEKHDGKIFIISAIDNLLKGASGQAVQNMNLMYGLDEREGLTIKAVAF